jgi:hypothetical protein
MALTAAWRVSGCGICEACGGVVCDGRGSRPRVHLAGRLLLRDVRGVRWVNGVQEPSDRLTTIATRVLKFGFQIPCVPGRLTAGVPVLQERQGFAVT